LLSSPLIMELVPVPIAPILRIGSHDAEAIMRLRLIVVARIHAGTVGRPQLPMVVIEDAKAAAATALARPVHHSRSRLVCSLRPATGAAAAKQSKNEPKPFGHAANPV
jgi:hypothetical protein